MFRSYDHLLVYSIQKYTTTKRKLLKIINTSQAYSIQKYITTKRKLLKHVYSSAFEDGHTTETCRSSTRNRMYANNLKKK
jgi:hypothetical protein